MSAGVATSADILKQVKEAPMTMLLPLVIFAVLIIVLGIWPTLITNYLSPFFA
jgi:NADH:ubiquinone oxidoreductase subunit 5 (subunit L)/multisubunit Na+/H+ antiporter MnhA subunit